MAIEPKTKMDQDRLTESLNRLSDEDPTFRVEYDDDSGQTIISGMGELHLEVVVDRLLREFQVDANVGKPQVSYRETIKKPVDEGARQVHQADRRARAVRRRRYQRDPDQAGARATCSRARSTAARSPRNTSRRWTAAYRRPSTAGVLAGYPLVDFKAELVDGSFHPVDSSEVAFKVAASMALKDAVQGRPADAARADHAHGDHRSR